MREVSGVQLLQLKNPWAKKRWKGAYSEHDTARWSAALREALQYDSRAAVGQVSKQVRKEGSKKGSSK